MSVNSEFSGPRDLAKEFQDFNNFASNYTKDGSFAEICKANEKVSRKFKNESATLLWQLLSQLLHTYSSISDSQNEKIIPLLHQHSNKQILPVSEFVEKKERYEELQKVPQRQTDDLRVNTVELADMDFVYGNKELDFESVDVVKHFRKGFLYIGNWQHEQVKEIQDGIKSESPSETTFSSRDDPPELLKVNALPTIAPWDPYETLRSFLFMQVRKTLNCFSFF